MFRRPIFWGIIAFLVCGAVWFVSVIFNVVTAGAFRDIANVAGIVAAASIPIAVMLELVRWIRRR